MCSLAALQFSHDAEASRTQRSTPSATPRPMDEKQLEEIEEDVKSTVMKLVRAREKHVCRRSERHSHTPCTARGRRLARSAHTQTILCSSLSVCLSVAWQFTSDEASAPMRPQTTSQTAGANARSRPAAGRLPSRQASRQASARGTAPFADADDFDSLLAAVLTPGPSQHVTPRAARTGHKRTEPAPKIASGDGELYA